MNVKYQTGSNVKNKIKYWIGSDLNPALGENEERVVLQSSGAARPAISNTEGEVSMDKTLARRT